MNFSCLLAAALFFIGNVLILVYYMREDRRSHYDYDMYTDMDHGYIVREWAWRIDNRGPHIAAGLINAFAWFFFAMPVLQLSWILSNQGTRMLGVHVMIAVLVLSGSFTEWISRFLSFGSNMAAELLVEKFQLENWLSEDSDDGLGWKVLEVVHIVTHGMVLFIDSFEWLVLVFVMVLIHVSVRKLPTSEHFGAFWSYLSLFISLFSLLDFIAEILRLDGFKTFSDIAYWYAIVNRLIFIPTWLLLLGRSLSAVAAQKQADAMGVMESAAGADGGFQQNKEQAIPVVPEGTFTIGDT